MDKYVNKKTIVKNSVYDMFKDSIICQICNSLMIEPFICLNCQNTFCEKCKEKLKENGENCPGKCQEPIIKNVIERNNNITRFKFKCIKGCGEEILFTDIKEHYSSDCLTKKQKPRVLTPEEVAEYKKKTDEDIPHVTSNSNINYFIIYFNIVITLGASHVGKSSLINT